MPPPSASAPAASAEPAFATRSVPIACFDLTGPALGAATRCSRTGAVESVEGVNLLMGYSFKKYLNPTESLSMYRTAGTILAVVPHIELGLDYRSHGPRHSFVIGAGLTYFCLPKTHVGIFFS